MLPDLNSALQKLDSIERVEDIEISLRAIECILMHHLSPYDVYEEDNNWPWRNHDPNALLVYFTDLLTMLIEEGDEMDDDEYDITIYELTEILRLEYVKIEVGIIRILRKN